MTFPEYNIYFHVAFTLESWLVSDPFNQTHHRIRISDYVMCSIHSSADLTNRGGDRQKCNILPESLAFAIVKRGLSNTVT